MKKKKVDKISIGNYEEEKKVQNDIESYTLNYEKNLVENLMRNADAKDPYDPVVTRLSLD